MLSAPRWLGRRARQYAYAFWVAALITVVTVKVFWLTDPKLVASFDNLYGALVYAGVALIAACIGIAHLVPTPGPSPMASTARPPNTQSEDDP